MIDITNIEEIIRYAAEVDATDIHLICDSAPAVRVHKELYAIENAEKLTPEICVHLALSIMSDKNKEELQSVGQSDFAFSMGDYGRFRANVFMQRGNVSLALRRISSKIPNFDVLNLPKAIKGFSNLHKGLVLITGATGSGKSTTLASLLDIINTEKRKHIITIEDPIEYLHEHKLCRVNQREIGNDTDSFAGALRAALREDPDVVLVGEMRDPETINIALTAAETGHLVFSTLHTVGAAKTIDRIIDVFPADSQGQIRSQLATVLKGVVSQELVPRCDKKGIVAACEVMITTPAISNLIREGKPHQINNMIQGGADMGMQTLDSHLADLCQKGIISYDHAHERAQDEKLFNSMTSRRW
ncbi:type IV pilus twitching motility protein PilT [Hathewaya histolytica]|uniref:Type IV pilus retraction protein n=1 Tax=Hathewaya histolytica TaxID=1498 RepID=A0A4U9R5J3_HATHI|nr:type IV pilus twitching motility protein PilT [Hathewaya histolytica]VTQ86615.1 type IV pilus retraction protein [Hathewaya histolytica]